MERARSTSAERDVRFAGYGDRVGSGVESAPVTWKGGETVSDREVVQRALNTIKPKRFFYSPIGDGVVAADGVEMKRPPPDLTPRVTVIQERVVEKGPPGQAGKRVIEKQWTTGGGDVPGDMGSKRVEQFGGAPIAQPSDGGPRAAPPAASLADSLNNALGAGPPSGAGPGTSGGYGGPAPLVVAAPPPAKYPSPPTAPKPDYSDPRFSPRSSLYDPRLKSPSNGLGSDYGRGPPSGRTSTTSDLFSEPGMRYEIDKYYRVTNPKELIHQYATTTPVSQIPGYESLPGGGVITQTIKESYSSTVEEIGPYPPYVTAGSQAVNPKKFVRQLRDETMTNTQRQANLNTQPLVPSDTSYHQRVEEVRRQSNRVSPNPEVDQLTSRLVTSLQTGHT